MYDLVPGLPAGTEMVILFFLLLALRVPVAFSLGLSALYAMWQIGFGLELAGDLIATGVVPLAPGNEDETYIKAGDVIEGVIEGIGTLRNTLGSA